jgi:membrane protease subunit HflC
VELVRRAGWFFKLPWPFDDVETYDRRVRYLDGRAAQIELADKYQLIPRVYATWQIVNPAQFKETLGGGAAANTRAELNLRNIVGNAAGAVLGRHTLHDVVNTDEDALKFDQIERQILQRVRADLEGQRYGVRVLTLGITHLKLPTSTTESVFERMAQERTRHAVALREAGNARKTELIAQAQAESDKIVASAKNKAKQTVADAEAQAAKYYKQFGVMPELAIFLRRLEALRNIAEAAAAKQQPITFVLDTDSEPFTLLQKGGMAVDATMASEKEMKYLRGEISREQLGFEDVVKQKSEGGTGAADTVAEEE